MLPRFVASSFVAVAIFFSSHAFAQEATVAGTVVDESGGVLPGAAVTATRLATGEEPVAVTGDRAEYRLLGLAAGRYNFVRNIFATEDHIGGEAR